MDAISNIHSVTVTLSQLQTSISQLTTYARRFKARLKGKNRSYIAQVIRLVNSIADHLRSLEKASTSEGCVQSSDLMAGKGVDQINPYKLCRYLQESKLARKVDGYVEFSREKADHQSPSKPSTPVLFHIQSFLLPLMNLSAEGRLFYSKTPEDVQLKYMLLDPTNHFREIVEDARAVILAGGTMSPVGRTYPPLAVSELTRVFRWRTTHTTYSHMSHPIGLMLLATAMSFRRKTWLHTLWERGSSGVTLISPTKAGTRGRR